MAIVDDKKCSGCLFNVPESDCKRNLEWEWRGGNFIFYNFILIFKILIFLFKLIKFNIYI